ncbi:MAG: ATPase domain-containing protein [Candidatus Bathyarchaeia archaeon]
MPRLGLIEDLTGAPILPGTNILVEFDPASQWYNASLTIAAGWLKTGGSVSYIAQSQSPEDLRSQLRQLGIAVDELEQKDRLWITDFYTLSLGRKSKEQYVPESLKVADLSIWIAREAMADSPAPEFLVIADNSSVLDRFNDEKNWVELYLTRPIPMAKPRQLTQLIGLMGGIHSNWAYKQLEAAVDGIVDFKVEEVGEETQDLMRIRTMRKMRFDRRWHELTMSENREVTFHK